MPVFPQNANSDIIFCRLRLENASSLERTESPSISITHQSEFELLDVAEIRQSASGRTCFPTAGTCSMSRAHRGFIPAFVT